MKKPSISVVIPAYNEEKYLPATLESLKKQTFSGAEIIVIDNNSTDGTGKIAEKYGARVFRETRQGTTYAREKGFQEAKADIIARTDADTVVTPNWLKTIHNTFLKNPDVVGITGPWLSSTPKLPDAFLSRYTYTISVLMGKLFCGHIYLLGSNMALRKSAWEQVKVHWDDKKVHEDIDLSYQLGKVGKLKYVPKMKVIFSARRISDNPIRGLRDYLGDYPVRYARTIYLNTPPKELKKRFRNRVKLPTGLDYLPDLVKKKYIPKNITIRNPYEAIRAKIPDDISGKIKSRLKI